MPSHLSLSLTGLIPAETLFKGLRFPLALISTQGCPPSALSLGLWFVVLEVTHCPSPLCWEHTASKAWICPVFPVGCVAWSRQPSARGLCAGDASRGCIPESWVSLSDPHSPHGALGGTGSMWARLDRWQTLRKTSLEQHFLARTGTEQVYLSCIWLAYIKTGGM